MNRAEGIRETRWLVLGVGVALLGMGAGVMAQSDPVHLWVGKLNGANVEKWTGEHLTQEQKYVDELLAVKGPRTIENTLRPFDNAQNELALAGFQAILMNGLAPEKEVRDAGEAMAQTVQEASNALELNQDVYKALAALNVSAADPATRHYVDRMLLEY